MGIALLGGQDGVVAGQARIPAAVDIVMELTGEALQCGICQVFAACMAQERTVIQVSRLLSFQGVPSSPR